MRKSAFLLIASSLLLLSVSATSKAKLTYYWLCMESEESGSGSKNTVLGTCSGKKIATVTSHYAERVWTEGSGKLNDGRVINLGDCDCDHENGDYNCFTLLDKSKYPWGIGSSLITL